MTNPKVLFVCSKGTEQLEFIYPYYLLSKKGANLTLAKVKEDENDTEKYFITNVGVKIIADSFIDDISENIYDMIVCPGGLPNAQILGKNEILVDMLKKQKVNNRWYCAICASPYEVFECNGILDCEDVTGYPGYGKFKGKSVLDKKVVISNKCITSQSPETAFEFGLTLCKVLFD